MPSASKTAALLAVLGTALAVPSTAAAARRSCDAQRGKTLAADAAVRLYSRPASRGRLSIRVCTYRTRVDRSLLGGASAKLADVVYAVSGSYAAAALHSTLTHPAVNSPVPPDTTYTALYLWDATRDRRRGTPTPLTGYRLQSLVLTTEGIVAAIGDPEGSALQNDGQATNYTESAVLRADLVGGLGRAWAALAKAQTGSIRDLAVSGPSLVWQGSGGLTSAMIAGPIVP